MSYPISDVERRAQFSGSAGAGPYSFTFEILEQTDIAVYVNSTLQTLTTHYTVTINVDGTGSITLVTPATGSDTVTIIGNRAIARTTDFVTGGDLLANSLNEELDSLVIFDQQLLEILNRSAVLSADVSDSVSPVLPSPEAGKVIGWNPTADALQNYQSNSTTTSDSVIYTPSGTGAVATTVQTKLREFVSVKDFGAVGDWNGATGTDDLAAFQAAIDAVYATGGGEVIVHYAQYKLHGRLNNKAGVHLVGVGMPLLHFSNAASGGDLAFLGSNASLRGLKIEIAGAQCVFIGATPLSNISVENCWLYDSGHTGIMFQANAAGCSNINIKNNVISGGTYGVLFNSSLTGSGAQIIGNFMYDNKCIELNTTSGSWTDTIIMGNTLDSSGSNGSSDAFAIGIAKGKRVVVSNNNIIDSYQEAIHLEDDSQDVVIEGNTINTTAVTKDGMRILQVAGGTSANHCISGNTIRCVGTPSGNTGINCVNDANGSAKNVHISGNIVINFTTGIAIGKGDAYNNAVNNTIVGAATTGISATEFTGVVSDNTFDSCTKLYAATNGGVVGLSNCINTQPTTLATNTNYSLTIKGLRLRGSGAHAAGGAAGYLNVLPLGSNSRFLGRCRALLFDTSTGTNTHVTESMSWDGATDTTITNIPGPAKGSAPLLTSPVFDVSGGNLRIGCTRTGAAFTLGYDAFIDGDLVL